MATPAHFRVDPRLAGLLGENYRSSEQALKELIDNAWDADAENVWITLPEAVTDRPIVIRDDGCGMTEGEVRQEYLNIANDRRSRKGELTHMKKRPVKGRKGIGKFAGLVATEVMDIDTQARGKRTRLKIAKQDLVLAHRDLERVDLPIDVADCGSGDHGTTIKLSELNQKLSFPSPAAMRELLVLEYGREPGFTIRVNDEPLAHEDIPGQQFTANVTLPDIGEVRVRFTIMDQPAKARHAGIVLRIGGKIVGPPSFLGLDERGDIPPRLLRQLVGEIEADGLAGDVTADWGAVLANSKGFQEVCKWATAQVGPRIDQAFKQEINLARARRQQEIQRRLAKLPEFRRELASKHLNRVLGRFYGESEDKIDVLVSLILDAMEEDEYSVVCEAIERARHEDVVSFAESLERFGLVDLAVMAQQATHRLRFLDALDELASKGETLEKEMHTALESNLWVFGTQYSLMASNRTLAKVVEDYTGKKFTGTRAPKRPDLLLSEDVLGRRLLIEFKRPSSAVDREAEAQAKEYRDDLTPSHGRMAIIVIGGSVDPSMSAHYAETDVQFLSFRSVVSTARTQLNWLIKELTTRKPPVEAVAAEA